MKAMFTGSVDTTVLSRVDEVAARRNVTRSSIIEWALQHFLDEHVDAVLDSGRGGRSDRDGKDAAALAIIKADLSRTIRETKRALANAGIKRSDGWISVRRADIKEGKL